MLDAFAKGFAQLSDPKFRKVLWNGVGLTLATFVLAALLSWQGLQLIPRTDQQWLNSLIDILSGLGLLVAMAFIFPGMTVAVLGLFLDDAAQAVEARHYPADPPGHPLDFWPALGQSVRFALVVVGLNLLVLPLYLLLFWALPVGALIYYGLNGYLFGREYFELVAGRHLSRPQVLVARRRYRVRVFLVGCVIAFLFTIPILNILVPLVATAAMVHIYKELVPSS